MDAAALDEAIHNNQWLRQELGNLSNKIDALTDKNKKLCQLLREARRATTISSIRHRSYNTKRRKKNNELVNKGGDCCPENWFASPQHAKVNDQGLDNKATENYILHDIDDVNFSPTLSQYVATKVRTERLQCSELPQNLVSEVPPKDVTSSPKHHRMLFEQTPPTPKNAIDGFAKFSCLTPSKEVTSSPPIVDLTNPRPQLQSPGLHTPQLLPQEEELTTAETGNSSNVQPIWDNSNVRREDIDVDALVVSDSSPPPPSQKHSPSEAEIELAAIMDLKHPRPYNDLLPPFDEQEFHLFQQVIMSSPKLEHHTHLHLDFNNQFLLELATPQNWVSTQTNHTYPSLAFDHQHMEVLMIWLSNRHQTLPPSEAGTFCSPHLINHILFIHSSQKQIASRVGRENQCPRQHTWKNLGKRHGHYLRTNDLEQ
uniref:Uncharacterized protein n=1 Tax=Noccaea caerulescens TaxID=107243 RepID=A0A1J3F9R7_NOCCA